MGQLIVRHYGKPQPQGSSSAYMRGGRIVVTSANKKLKPFRKALSESAALAMQQAGYTELLAEKGTPVGINIDATFLKPPSAKKRVHHTVKPDLSKLIRAVEDSMTGIVWHDDCMVTEITAHKNYGPEEMVHISIYTL